MTTTLHANAIETLVKVARQATPVLTTVSSIKDVAGLPDEIPISLNPIDGSVTSLQAAFEKYRMFPERKSGVATVTSIKSLAELTNRHKTKDTAIFADTNWRAPSFQTVVDYHAVENGGHAGNLGHRINYKFPFSEEWTKWTGLHGKPLGQHEFAEFVEDNIQDFIAPDGEYLTECPLKQLGYKYGTPSELITFSRGVVVTSGNTFAIESRLSDGSVALAQKVESTTHSKTGDKITIPELFLLDIPTFAEGEKKKIVVRMRTRDTGAGLMWSFLLYRPDLHIAALLNEAIERLKTDTDLPIFLGSPEA